MNGRSLAFGALVTMTLVACGEGRESRKSPLMNSVSVSSVDLPFIDESMFGLGQTAESDGTASVVIYNANSVVTIPTPLYRGVKVMNDGQRTLEGTFLPLLVTDDVTAASENLTTTRDFYQSEFNRNSYDNAGAKIIAAVEVQQYHLIPILGMKENAAWMQPFGHFMFGAGGSRLGGFAQALDVVGHEFTHAVISSTSNLEYVGQSGALNEHLADVFGEMIQHAAQPDSEPFLIGETTLRGDFADQARALRDMLNPEEGLSKQPGHMDDIPEAFGTDCVATSSNDNCGVHTLSGIPNRAAAKIIQGLGWEKSHTLFYTVMTERLNEHSDFAEYRNAVVSECTQTLSNADCNKIEAAFASVGL